jgi:serine/threonine protein kinase
MSIATMRSWSPELQKEAARRLGSVCLLFGTLKLVSIPFMLLLNFMVLTAYDYLLAAGFVVASLVLYGLVKFERFSPAILLDLGYLYAVIGAFALGLSINKMPFPASPVAGWSPVAIWAFIFPVLVPARAWRVFAVAFFIAIMDPLSYLTLVVIESVPKPDQFPIARFAPAGFAVLLAPMISRIVYRLGSEATKARELGSYRLVEPLGKGGMGEVWRAEHRMLARPAAAKLIRPEALSSNPGAASTVVKRFEREAQATAQLTSPNTVHIYDFGTTDDGTFFYVMELLEGIDMETLVNRYGPLPPNRVVHLMRQVARSLREAHERGLVHRDIKPANLFICRCGGIADFVKVLDFGLVTTTFESDALEDAQLTRDGLAPCTPGYVAPEIATGKRDFSGSADLYSLGCVAYWLLTGELLFEGDTAMAMIVKHVSEAPGSPSEKSLYQIPDELDRLVLQLLAKDPDDRPKSAKDLEIALGQIPGEEWTEESAEDWWTTHQPTQRRDSGVIEMSDSATLVRAATN